MAAQDADSTPAIAAPPGYTSNLENPHNTYHHTILTVVLSLVITAPLVGARLFTRIRLHGETNPEDWLLVAAEITFVAFLSLLIALPAQGVHEWDVSLRIANQFSLLVNVLEFIYIIPLLLSKMALIVQLRRIFTANSTIKGFVYWALQTLIFVNLASYAAIIIWGIVYLTKQSQDFDPNCTGECHNSNYLLVATGILNAVVDIATICIPLYAVSALQMTLRKKIGVTAVFGIGALACAASIFRAVESFGPIDNQLDQTYTSFPVFYWAAAEIAAVIAATSIPCLPKLWKETRKHFHPSRYENAEPGYNSYRRAATARGSRKSRVETILSTSMNGTVLSSHGHRRGHSDPEDVEMALIQDRIRGWGIGMGATQSVVGGCPDRVERVETTVTAGSATTRTGPGSGFWSRGRSRRASVESGLREMPVVMQQQPNMPGRVVVAEGGRSRRTSGGILKTVEVEISSV